MTGSERFTESGHSAHPPRTGRTSAVIGLQWGDEGKGKFVDLLASGHDAIVRYNGGANAGHSVVIKGERFSLHLVPSGIMHPGKRSIIANGVVVSLPTLLQEVTTLRGRGVDVSGLVLSDRAHLVLPYHRGEDALREDLLKALRLAAKPAGEAPAVSGAGGNPGGGVSEIGTTKRGIGPTYADKIQRATAIRVGDLARPDVLRQKLELACSIKNATLAGLSQGEPVRFDPSAILAETLDAWGKLGCGACDTTYLIHELLDAGKGVLFEGANGSLLDVDHGTYPFVTSSTCIAAGVGVGAGLPPQRLGQVIGVMKAYSTRVGSGPMPTELLDSTGERIRQRGREFGTTTGRPRRVGWLDLVAVRYSAMINGASSIAMTMLDVLSGLDQVHICTAYEIAGERTTRFQPDGELLQNARPVYTTFPGFSEDIATARRVTDLPAPARRYVEFIQETVGVRIGMISVGPDREQTIEVP
ncbi:MAG: adenylosuccinate synthase [Planctomycetota bacterium]|nr:adenylosuccinate synthase [Planctomycetota bacterium]